MGRGSLGRRTAAAQEGELGNEFPNFIDNLSGAIIRIGEDAEGPGS